jgi:release factor glutamine methyltransferase
MSPEELILKDEHVLSDFEWEQIEDLVNRRLNYEPVAYLLARREFFGLSFEVNSEVLIPRPETESLIEGVLGWIRKKDLREGVVLDLGTGSGCIAISLSKSLSRDFEVWGLEKSEPALRIARRNADRLGGIVHWIGGDIFQDPSSLKIPTEFSILVSNPPYIPEGEWSVLPPDIQNFEPKEALLGGKDGTTHLRAILKSWLPHLRRPGLLALETHGGSQLLQIKEKVPVEVAKEIWHDGPHLFIEV